MDAYFPKTFVKQEDLEQFDGVGKGKYTIGLEQETMAFTNDREDIYSMSLSAVSNLLEKYNISPDKIGRLEVGTETIVDKSKSIKTVLMTLFEKSKNTNIEGVDTVNACYGGTSALMNAVNWIESSSWDGRYAIVVAGDIAVYAPGNARPTGGAGVVAMLIGPNAPIFIERGLRGSYFEHAWDFYKPNLSSEYPLVDGKLSISCYLRALDSCYDIYREKFQKLHNKPFNLDETDYALFHSPYTKLVRKSYARLAYLDFLANDSNPKYSSVPKALKTLSAEESYNHKEVGNIFNDLVKDPYKQKVEPSLFLPKKLGNSYTASLYTGLLSLVSQKSDKDLKNKRVLMFSYGSGLAATMWSFNIGGSISDIAKKANIVERINQRISVTPQEYTEIMKLREDTHSQTNYKPISPTTNLFPGTFYLENIDELKRRHYSRV